MEYVIGGGNLPPWCVGNCTCWDAECVVHGQEAVPLRDDTIGVSKSKLLALAARLEAIHHVSEIREIQQALVEIAEEQ